MSSTATASNPPLTVAPPGSLASRAAGPLLVATVLVMLIVPLSPAAISFAFALNIAIGLLVLAAAIYVQKPADFLAFPSILLGTTLLRLALNVATARAILLRGYTGTDAAGRVIEAFGRFVVGGNFAVGFLIFMILIVINFVVVTKGAGRVAEVSARFMLDSLPGRQMAIDADVNAGSLSAKEAERRREMLRREADFFGAMDGASKFVRGDVIAAMIILAINMIFGLLVGMLQHGLSIDVAARTYTLLTVGDGVAAQIPSLSISVAAGLIVTRVATGEDIGAQVVGQISNYPQAIFMAAGLLAGFGLMPGMAHIPFLAFAVAMGLLGFRLRARARAEADASAEPEPVAAAQPLLIDANAVQKVDPFGLEIGFALIPLLQDPPPGKPDLLTRLTAVRVRRSREIGFVLPSIHVRDADGLNPNEYRFMLRGAPIAAGEVQPNAWLAIETPEVTDKLAKGRRVKDPVYGQDALWIAPGQVRDAEAAGYTVADPGGVIATHLGLVLDRHAAEMLGRTEVEEILSVNAKTYPKMIEELRDRVQLGVVREVLQDLVAEDVPIKDFGKIAEAMLDTPDTEIRDAERVLSRVRVRIGRQVIARFLGRDQVLRVLALEPNLESLVTKAIGAARDQGMDQIIEPTAAQLLRSAARSGITIAEKASAKPVLAVQERIRRPVARCLAGIIPVIAAEEIPSSTMIVVLDTLQPERQLHGPS